MSSVLFPVTRPELYTLACPVLLSPRCSLHTASLKQACAPDPCPRWLAQNHLLAETDSESRWYEDIRRHRYSLLPDRSCTLWLAMLTTLGVIHLYCYPRVNCCTTNVAMEFTHRNIGFVVALCKSQQKQTTAITHGIYTSQPRRRNCDV